MAMQAFWVLRNYATEGRRLVRTALRLPEVEGSELVKSHALFVGAELAACQGDYHEARGMLETCLELRRTLGDVVNTATTLADLALARLQSGDASTAQANASEALSLFKQQGDRWGEAIGLLRMGQIAIYERDPTRARDWLRQV
ncbi:MAG: tetratricopeptide repeat protein, partial [Blastochloris sp.]|nr:tetratricopeptide repeat protein [Blastochloris sp.]